MAVTAAITIGAVATGYTIYAGEKQRQQQKKQLKEQKRANEDARKRAEEQVKRADIAENKANQKRVDTAAIQSKEEQAALVGGGGTMLTGNQGVNPDNLTLGGNTLLGG